MFSIGFWPIAEAEHVQGIRVGARGFQKLKEPLRETPGISAICEKFCASHKILDFFVRCTNCGQSQGAGASRREPGKRIPKCSRLKTFRTTGKSTSSSTSPPRPRCSTA